MFSQYHPEIKRINKWLLDTLGFVPDTIMPKFRLVWGPSIIVKRKVYDRSGEPKGYEDRRKYQYIAPNAFVLEGYFTVPDTETLGCDKGSFEPLHTFYDYENKPVDPTLNAVQLFMDCLREGIERSKYENSLDVDRASEKDYERDWTRIYDHLNSDSALISQLKSGTAVSFGGIKVKES